jgi:hypothetical protein
MPLEALFVIAVAMFVVLRFIARPWAARRVQRDRSTKAVRWHGVYCLLGVVQSAALLTSLVCLVLLSAFYIIDAWGGIATAQLEGLMAAAQACRDVLASLGAGWITLAGVLLLTGWAVHSYLRGKRQMHAALERVVQSQVSSIVERLQAGTLEPLPPSAEMQRVASMAEHNLENRRNADNDSTLTDEQRAMILAQFDEAVRELEIAYVNLDIERRIDATVNEEAVALPKPRNWRERFLNLFISEGLVRTQSAISRVVYAAILIALIPASLSGLSGAATVSLDRKMMRLNDLRLSLAEREAEDAWSDATSTDREDEQKELSDDDHAVVSQVASLVEAAALMAIDVSPHSLAQPLEFSVHASSVRQRILASAAKASAGVFDASLPISKVPGIEPDERLAALSVESPEPVTRTGKEVQSKLELVAQRDSKLVARWRKELAAFRRPVGRTQLAKGIMGQALDDGIGLSRKHGAMLNSVVRTRMTQAAASLASGRADLPSAVNIASTPDPALPHFTTAELVEVRTRLGHISERVDKAGDRLAARLRTEYPPSTTPARSAVARENSALKAVENLRNRYAAGSATALRGSEGVADVLASYTDHFPGQIRADGNTLRGRVLNKWSPDLFKQTAATRSLHRSRSFSGLRGFSRVGGVLIGRDPVEVEKQTGQRNDKGPVLACIDIDWRWSGGKLEMTLVDAQGKRHVSRPHRARLVQQALSYAADGRPLTVTIIEADPTPFRQVLLHPTLVDSALGQRMIELDQFVYRFASDRPEFHARRNVWGQSLLYQMAWAIRLGQVKDSTLFSPEFAKFIESQRQFADRIKALLEKEGEPHNLMAAALQYPTELRDPSKSPLPKMTDYFDPSLVTLVQTAAERSSELSEFIAYIERATAEQARPYAEGAKKLNDGIERMKAGQLTEFELRELQSLEQSIAPEVRKVSRWALPCPEFREASGVREGEFRLQASSLIVAPSTDVPAEALVFTVQLAFTSPAYFQEGEEDVLPEPWEYEAIKPLVEAEVKKGIAESSLNQQILADALEFTLLQRLFRMALTGRLGYEFPCEKLAILSEELAERLPAATYRTDRWDLTGFSVPVDAVAETRLVSQLLSDFDLLPPREDSEESEIDAERCAKLDVALAQLKQAIAKEKEPVGRSDILAHADLLQRRLRDVAALLKTAESIQQDAAKPDGPRLQAAWDKYAEATTAWRSEWDRLSPPGDAEKSWPEKIQTAVQQIQIARDELPLQDALGLRKEAHLALFRKVLEAETLPPLE